MTQKFEVDRGKTHPLGAVPDGQGVNFSLFSQNATGVELLLFDSHDAAQPSQVIRFNPETNRSFYIWHLYVKGLRPSTR